MSTSSRLRLSAASVLLGMVSLNAQQPNGLAAAAIWGGIDGPPWPVFVVVDASSTGALSLDVLGHPLAPFALAESSGGLQTPGTHTSIGILDLDAAGIALHADGISQSTGSPLDAVARISAAGVSHFLLPLWPPSSSAPHALQVLVGDPSSAVGFRLTAATSLIVSAVPPTAIFVSAATGSLSNPGTQAQPLSTIGSAISLSRSLPPPHPPVYVAAGTYAESTEFRDGVSVHGGLNAANWAWSAEASTLVLTVGTPPTARDIITATAISGLSFLPSSGTASGSASIGFRAISCSGSLRFERCRFLASNGADGAPGTPALAFPFGCAGGAGGNSGQPGSPGGCQGGAGGAAGGGNGGPGFHGFLGSPGLASVPNGTVAGEEWVPGDGGIGGVGSSGGGGGGGGGGWSTVLGCNIFGVCNIIEGGWGGYGGWAGGLGFGGGGGQGGGGSLAVLLIDSSPVFIACDLVAANGGSGGEGGPGGTAGPGSPGTPGFIGANGSWGGNGGAGGNGGPGGSGAGGAGGPSYCVFRSGTSNPDLAHPQNVFSFGTGGAGGLGGPSAPAGPAGGSGIMSP